MNAHENRPVLVALLIVGFILGFGIGTSAQTGLTVSHLLSQITATDGTSVDVDDDGIIDSAEMACGPGTNCFLDNGDLGDGSVTTPKVADNAIVASKIPSSTINTNHVLDATIVSQDVDSGQIQLRVSGTCAVGNAIKQINSNGTVLCEPIPPAGGSTPTYTTRTGSDTTASPVSGFFQYVATTGCPPTHPNLVACTGGITSTSAASNFSIRQFEPVGSGNTCTNTMILTVNSAITVYAYAHCAS